MHELLTEARTLLELCVNAIRALHPPGTGSGLVGCVEEFLSRSLGNAPETAIDSDPVTGLEEDIFGFGGTEIHTDPT